MCKLDVAIRLYNQTVNKHISTYRPQIFRFNILKLSKKHLNFCQSIKILHFQTVSIVFPSVGYLHKVSKYFGNIFQRKNFQFVYISVVLFTSIQNLKNDIWNCSNILIKVFEQGFAMITFQRRFNHVYCVKKINAFHSKHNFLHIPL